MGIEVTKATLDESEKANLRAATHLSPGGWVFGFRDFFLRNLFGLFLCFWFLVFGVQLRFLMVVVFCFWFLVSGIQLVCLVFVVLGPVRWVQLLQGRERG